MMRVPAFWGEGETILRFGEGLTAEDEGETGGPADLEAPAWLRARAAPEAASPTSAAVRCADLPGPRQRARARGTPRPRAPADAARRPGSRASRRRQGLSRRAWRRSRRRGADCDRGPDRRRHGRAGARRSVRSRIARRGRLLPECCGGRGGRTRLQRPPRPHAGDGRGCPDRRLQAGRGARPARRALMSRSSPLYRAALRPLYPSLPVRAALVYLDGPTVRPIEAAELEAALDAAGPA